MLGPDLGGKRILDVGCGLGAGCWLLHKRGARVTGVDISQDAIAWARRTYSPEAAGTGRQLDFWAVDLLAQTGGGIGTFDALTLVDVLEHFAPREGAELLARLRLLLRPSGQMFLHLPITANTLDWVLLAKNGLIPKRLHGRVLDHHGDPTHLVRYSVHSATRLLAAAGWETQQLELRAYSPRLPRLERAVRLDRWGLLARLQQQVVTDWDGIHTSRQV